MARKPASPPAAPPPKVDEAPPAAAPRRAPLKLSDSGSAQAPFIYFEDAPAFGHLNGVIRITLEAVRTMASEQNAVLNERVVTAHLRMNIPAARSLMAALRGALLMAAPPESSAKN